MPNDTSSKLQKGELRFTILGTRGSMTTASPEMMRYGGNTTSYLFETEEEAIIIDAGTGIMNPPDVGEKRLSLIITHTHIDHILGLPMLLGSLRYRNIIVYDAQYTPDEYEQCRGFGHSTYEQAVIIQQKADIKEMLLVHHGPVIRMLFWMTFSAGLRQRAARIFLLPERDLRLLFRQ